METKKREGYKVVIDKECLEAIKRKLCPICKKPKKEWQRRKDWTCCSKICTEEYLKKHYSMGWQQFRSKIFKRDGWICVKCNYKAKTIIKKEWSTHYSDEFIKKYYNANSEVIKVWIEDEHYCAEIYDTSELIADHIIPIAIGGDEWDINNIQTLCKQCNKIKTKADAQNIAIFRKTPSSQKNLNYTYYNLK